MKHHCGLTRSLALTIAIMLVVSISAGCGAAPTPTKPSEAETTFPAAPSETGSLPVETTKPNTEPSTEPEAATVPTAKPDDVTELSTEPATEPAAKPATEPTTEPTAKPATEPTVPPTESTKPAVDSNTEPGPTEHTHSFRSQVTAPTCTAKGFTTYTCQVCGYSYTGDETNATGHSYRDTVTAPTCTQDGYTLHQCTVCGESFTDQPTAAKGHAWGPWTIAAEPTYSSEGKEERTCSACGATESRSIAKLTDESQMEWEVFRLVNLEREKAGFAPLQYFSDGQEAADIRTKEIQESFSHTRPDGRSCFTVLDDLSLNHFMIIGENIAYGFETPEAVVEAWMNSEGHRANILSEEFTGIVVGFESNYWVQIFVGGSYG